MTLSAGRLEFHEFMVVTARVGGDSPVLDRRIDWNRRDDNYGATPGKACDGDAIPHHQGPRRYTI
jgi:hypothetical protein